jgi:hypothetical protein
MRRDPTRFPGIFGKNKSQHLAGQLKPNRYHSLDISYTAPFINVERTKKNGLLKSQLVQYAPNNMEMVKTIYMRQYVTTTSSCCLLPA